MATIEDSLNRTIYTPDEPLQIRLDKVRVHKTSKLSHQNHLALILSAVEENLEEQKTEETPAAYFVSFLSLLDQAFTESGISNKELADSTVYLLDLVVPYISPGLLRSKFTPILTKLAQALSNPESDAPLLRSSIGVLETILIAQDSSTWSQSATQLSPRRAVLGLAALAIDPRPKVRKRAQDAITRILANPPPSPKFEHPASTIAAETALQGLNQQLEEEKRVNKKLQQQLAHQKSDGVKSNASKAIHSLQLIKSINRVNQWPAEKIEQLCEILLQISRTSDQYLVVAAFDVFEAIFHGLTEDIVDEPKLVQVLDIIIELKPSTTDQHLAPAWLAVVAQAGASYAKLQPTRAFARLPKFFTLVVEFFKSDSKNVRISASQCLVALISTSISPDVLLAKKNDSSVDKILAKISDIVFSLLHIQYHGSWQEVTGVLVALFDQLRWRSAPHLINALKVVGSLRSEESFAEGRENSDNVIAAAIRALGPELVLHHLPLNLDPLSRNSNGRAWLLPLLRDNIQHTNLAHFIHEFVPLSEKFVQKIDQLQSEGESSSGTGDRSMQIKIFQTLNDQIWSLLPRYTDLPRDLRSAFDQNFAELLSNVLYQKVEYRPGVCLALRLIVESNVAYSEGAVDDDLLLLERFPKTEAVKNVKYLAKEFASKILSVLFNVFSQTLPEFRNYILECINAYLSITPVEDIEATFNKVASLLHSSLEELSSDNNSAITMSSTMLDLVVTITPFLPKSCHNSLLSIFVTLSKKSEYPQLQKKVFRAFTRLAESEGDGELTVRENMENILNAFIQLGDKVSSPARGAKLSALSKIIDFLPSTDLHFIPSILSETVLSTKDVNEKTREAAYNLLVKMGRKMQEGGIVQHSKVPDMDADAPNVQATLDEYFTMVSAGLAGSTPHMISSTITALSRILFEFRDDISVEMLKEMSSTVELFLTSNSREIVKSTLGFVKITVISLPVEIVEPELKSLITNLMVWSHEHTAHFRAKVKHIIERLVRRFGYEKIASNFPEEDLKLLTNIRKTRERAKRQSKTREQNDDEDDDGEDSGKKKKGPSYSNEFEKAVYGSSSDDSDNEGDSDVEMANTKKRGERGQRERGNNKYILEDENEPLDLLDRRSLGHISSTKPRANNAKLHIKDKNKFAKDISSGKIVIKEVENNEIDEDSLDIKSGIDAYVEAIKNGPVRGQRNKLKYKRSRKHNIESDDDGDDGADEVNGNANFAKGSNKTSVGPKRRLDNNHRVGKKAKVTPRKKF